MVRPRTHLSRPPPHVWSITHTPTPTNQPTILRTHLLELRLLRDPGRARERDAVLVDAEELVDHRLVRPLRQAVCVYVYLCVCVCV